MMTCVITTLSFTLENLTTTTKHSLNDVVLYLGVPTSRPKQENKILPRPFDDDQDDSSELSSDEEDTRERIGLDFS